MNNAEIVEAEIGKLLDLGCIAVCESTPVVVNPLTVAFNKTGKPRLVLDCRHVNQFLCNFKFRLEDNSVARHMFNTGDYLFSFDLKSAYHHIEIHPDYRGYLGFRWKYQGREEYFVFNVLPFGISTAAYIFTKVTRVAVRYWRKQGMRIIMYLDDGLGVTKVMVHH